MHDEGWPRRLWLVGTALLVVMLVHIAAMAVLGGPVSGPVSLRKPATFAETGWLLCWMTALILPALPARPWQRHVVGTVVTAFAVLETTVIGIQAWRGVPSHYNFTTALDMGLMRGGAGGTAAVFVIGMIVLLVTAVRARDVAPGVRLGVVAGVAVVLVGGAVGLAMISNNSGVYQGRLGTGFGLTGAYLGPTAATVGPDHLGFRPATAGGDLILPHAVAVHGLVLLTLPALLLARTSLGRRTQLALVAAAVGAVGVALVVLLTHAARQLPLRDLHPIALTVLAACAVTVLAVHGVAARALLTARRPPTPPLALLDSGAR
jgi:hypothetical protein